MIPAYVLITVIPSLGCMLVCYCNRWLGIFLFVLLANLIIPMWIALYASPPDIARYELSPHDQSHSSTAYVESFTINTYGNIVTTDHWERPLGTFWQLQWQHITEPRCFDPCDWKVEEIRRPE